MNPRDPQQLDAQVAELSYEDARSKLVDTVARLEQGNIPLEEASNYGSSVKHWLAVAKRGLLAPASASPKLKNKHGLCSITLQVTIKCRRLW